MVAGRRRRGLPVEIVPKDDSKAPPQLSRQLPWWLGRLGSPLRHEEAEREPRAARTDLRLGQSCVWDAEMMSHWRTLISLIVEQMRLRMTKCSGRLFDLIYFTK